MQYRWTLVPPGSDRPRGPVADETSEQDGEASPRHGRGEERLAARHDETRPRPPFPGAGAASSFQGTAAALAAAPAAERRCQAGGAPVVTAVLASKVPPG